VQQHGPSLNFLNVVAVTTRAAALAQVCVQQAQPAGEVLKCACDSMWLLPHFTTVAW
jgi:hypothetical protein